MIDQGKFFKALNDKGVEFFTGVPDSYLNAFCTYLTENVSSSKHMIAANEGNAVALASGYYFTTGTVPLVYMQNSGMGNALNPLVSLVDKDVYSVPMVLLIGWRGDPSVKDHAQHKTQGEITTKLLDILGIPYVVAKDDDECIEETVSWAVRTARDTGVPAVLIAHYVRIESFFGDYSELDVRRRRPALKCFGRIINLVFPYLLRILFSGENQTGHQEHENQATTSKAHGHSTLIYK